MLYCKFIKTVKFDNEIIWEENKEYAIAYEDENNFYFDEPPKTAIAKSEKNKVFITIYKHE